MQLRLTSDEVVQTREDQSLYTSLKKAGIYLVASCGGKGVCGKCKVKVLDGASESVSHTKLTAKELKQGMVLACQTFPRGDLLLEIPKESKLVIGDKIALAKTKNLVSYLESYGVVINPPVKRMSLQLPPPTINDNISDLERMKRTLKEKGLADMRFTHGFVSAMAGTLREAKWIVDLIYVPGNGMESEAIFLASPGYHRRYGLAIDIGTTTVVVYLVKLIDGSIVDVGSTYNSQIRFGDDVITRIVHATESGGLDELRNAVAADINTIVSSLLERHDLDEEQIYTATVAANTTMSHIFWGMNPASIREEPYIPTVNFFPLWKGGTAKLRVNAQAPVYTVPSIASYVGGDIVAGVLASKMHRHPEIALFMDIGTNGEIAVGNNEWLMTAACSAGPCFEGSGIRCGMRATSGAIEAIKIDKETFEPEISVIGGGTAMGICGSGMIDAVSEMFLTGILDLKGKFISGKTGRVRESEEGLEYLFFPGDAHRRDIVLTEPDIENLLRAKAAIYAGVTTLLAEVGLTIDSIERIYIAGGFGNYINVERAIILGMLPDAPRERFVFMGNTSITGAYLCLLSEELRDEAEKIASQMTYVELSVSHNFMDKYMSALFLPHTDISQFPTVQALLQK